MPHAPLAEERSRRSLHKLIQYLKRILPRGAKQWIKKMLGYDSFPASVDGALAKPDVDPQKINISIHAGGGLGDFIVYSAIVDQLLAMCSCDIYIFTLSYANAEAVLGNRENVYVYYPFWEIPSDRFDVSFELDHDIRVREFNPKDLKAKSAALYKAAARIAAHNRKFFSCDIDNYLARRNVLMYRSKFLGLNRWTQLSYDGLFDMGAMRAYVPVDESRAPFLAAHGLAGAQYIVAQCGADRDLGGMKQVKVWPLRRYEEFAALFKAEYPGLKIVQIAVKSEPQIGGADILIKGAQLEDIKLVLRSARALVAGEGGIVHLAVQLGVRCVVLFGPTPAHYYGYPTNANIVSPACSGCMEATDDWAKECPRRLNKPICMDAITGEMALEGMRKILRGDQPSAGGADTCANTGAGR
jgi:hypothetical protein